MDFCEIQHISELESVIEICVIDQAFIIDFDIGVSLPKRFDLLQTSAEFLACPENAHIDVHACTQFAFDLVEVFRAVSAQDLGIDPLVLGIDPGLREGCRFLAFVAVKSRLCPGDLSPDKALGGRISSEPVGSVKADTGCFAGGIYSRDAESLP